MQEQIFTKRNKRRTLRQQVADIYDESVRLGVKNPPTLREHLQDIGRSVTEMARVAEQQSKQRAERKQQEAPTTEREGESQMARRKTFTDSHGMTREIESQPKQAKTLKEATKVVEKAVGKRPSRSEQVLEIIQANGGATLAKIAETLQISRDASWGATRNLIQAGRVKSMRQSEDSKEQIYVGVDA
jgi:predicted HTH transcriptional regulator